jgi:small basic protein
MIGSDVLTILSVSRFVDRVFGGARAHRSRTYGRVFIRGCVSEVLLHTFISV